MHAGEEIPMVHLADSAEGGPVRDYQQEARHYRRAGRCRTRWSAFLPMAICGVSIEKGFDVFNRPIGEVMTRNPKRILRTNLAAKALQRMEEHSITSLFVFETEESRAHGHHPSARSAQGRGGLMEDAAETTQALPARCRRGSHRRADHFRQQRGGNQGLRCQGRPRTQAAAARGVAPRHHYRPAVGGHRLSRPGTRHRHCSSRG